MKSPAPVGAGCIVETPSNQSQKIPAVSKQFCFLLQGNSSLPIIGTEKEVFKKKKEGSGSGRAMKERLACMAVLLPDCTED